MTTIDFNSLTEAEAKGIQHFDKPAPGTWTEAFDLPTGPLSQKDSYDQEFFEMEKEAVFKRSWLHLGRVERLPRNGTYFTSELEFLGVSVLVTRGMDGEIRAFHNVCSHRGNKLMWDEYPNKESSGSCRQFACKYHGWRYDLDGEVSYVHNAPEFFDLEAAALKLPEIHCDVWNGFIFICLDSEPRQTLREFLGGVTRLDDYPFEKMTSYQQIEGPVNSNWKLLMDAFQELYHVPYVHSKMNNPGVPATGSDKVPFMMPKFFVYGKHRLYTSSGPLGNFAVRNNRPLDDMFGSDFYGPVNAPDIGDRGEGCNPAKIENWGLDSWQIYPNLCILTWGFRNWYITYQYWPVTATTHKLTWNLYFVPAKTARERIAQEHAVLSGREFAIQDAGAVDALQAGIQTGAYDDYQFCDQEVLARHLHYHVQNDVAEYARELAEKGKK